RARVQRVDGHLRVGRAGYLDPAVDQPGRRRRDPPVAVADGRRLGQEVEVAAGGQPLLPLVAQREQLGPAAVEGAVQQGEQLQRAGREYLVEAFAQRPGDLD